MMLLSASPPLMNAPPNIGKYQLAQLLGQGACGSVYLGTDTFSGSKVAVKIIDPEVFRDPEHGELFRSQFLNEVALAGKLNHPHIVSILDAAAMEDGGYVVMEYVPGGTLAEWTGRQRHFDTEDAIEVGFKCCGALDYAFREGVVHRDIKPANIMVVHDTEVKIADFGAALLRGTGNERIVNIGSPSYMSPEQIRHAPLTHQSDMYSLGVVMYELLTGHRPFSADSIDELLQKVLTEDPLPLTRQRDGLPPELDAVILKALSKNPEDRYATWADFALELAQVGRLNTHRQRVPDMERFEALKGVELLASLPEQEIWEVAHAARWHRLPAQSTLIREQDTGDSLYLLLRGQAKVTKAGRLLNTIAAGEFFGEMSYIREGELPRQATVQSLTEVLVCELEPRAVKLLSAGCQLHFTRGLLRTLVDRLALADVRISQLAT